MTTNSFIQQEYFLIYTACKHVTTNPWISCMHDKFYEHNRKNVNVEKIKNLKRKIGYQKLKDHAVYTNIGLI